MDCILAVLSSTLLFLAAFTLKIRYYIFFRVLQIPFIINLVPLQAIYF